MNFPKINASTVVELEDDITTSVFLIRYLKFLSEKTIFSKIYDLFYF